MGRDNQVPFGRAFNGALQAVIEDHLLSLPPSQFDVLKLSKPVEVTIR